MTPPCTTQRTQQSQSRSRFHRIQMNILVVFLWLVEQVLCETILEQMWGSSLGRGGPFSELNEQFQSGRTPGCQWCNLARWNASLQNPDASSVHIDVGQICCVPDDVFMIILIKHWRNKRCNTHRNWSRSVVKEDHGSGPRRNKFVHWHVVQ